MPYGLKSFAKPDMASQNRRKKLRRYIQLSTTRRNVLRRFWEAMSGFTKLLSPKGKLWIVALLVGSLHLISFAKSTQEIALRYSVIAHSTQFLVSILRSHVWLHKALEPEGQAVDCCTTTCSPSIEIRNASHVFKF